MWISMIWDNNLWKLLPENQGKRKLLEKELLQKTPKAAKKKGNPSFISVVESVLLSTSENPPSPKPTEDPSPQTFDDFDIDFDTSLSLDNLLNNPPTTHLDQKQPGLAQALSILINLIRCLKLPTSKIQTLTLTPQHPFLESSSLSWSLNHPQFP